MNVFLLFTPLGQRELQFVNAKTGVIDTLRVTAYQQGYFIDEREWDFCNRLIKR